MRSLAFLLLLGAAPPPAKPAAAPAVAPARHTLARDLACSLADEVGARLAGSEGDVRAVAWATAKMKALGLANVRAEPVKVPHWERGEASGELVAPFKRKLWLAALGNSLGTPPAGVEAEVVRVTTLEELAKLPDAAVKGRIVFFDKVMERLESGDGYGKTVDVRGRGAVEAEKKGAVATVIRSVGTSESRFPHTGGMRNPERAVKVPAFALAIPDAELLRRVLEKGPAKLRLVSSARFLPDADSANVVGEVPGSKRPEQVVVLGAHLDAWDLGDGAVDDAAGVGVVLEVAAALVKAPLERTVRVVLFANEENGLRGAGAYAQKYQAELVRHVAAMEIDSGAGRALRVAYSAGPDAAAALTALGGQLEKQGLALSADAEAGGADSGELTGVPLFQIRQDCARYFDVHHTADDTCEKIHDDELSTVTAAALAITRHVGQATVELGRRPPAKH